MLYLVVGPWGSGKSSLVPHLTELLPSLVVFDWDIIIPGISTASGKNVFSDPATWDGLIEAWTAILKALLRGEVNRNLVRASHARLVRECRSRGKHQVCLSRLCRRHTRAALMSAGNRRRPSQRASDRCASPAFRLRCDRGCRSISATGSGRNRRLGAGKRLITHDGLRLIRSSWARPWDGHRLSDSQCNDRSHVARPHPVVTIEDIRSAVRTLDLAGFAVCLHASLRLFGWVFLAASIGCCELNQLARRKKPRRLCVFSGASLMVGDAGLEPATPCL